MVVLINHKELSVARKIHSIFQAGYQVEADLIGAEIFPPLKRTVEDIQQSPTTFYRYGRNEQWMGIMEVEEEQEVIDICSLVVDPDFFRQGVGRGLIEFLIQNAPSKNLTVETAMANLPAVWLYKKLGFETRQIWVTPEGIEKVSFFRNQDADQ